MPVILCRHGATAKNIEGGIDDRSTLLHSDGLGQSREAGERLARFCQQYSITSLQPVTSGFDRTNASCIAALEAFSALPIEIMPIIEDDRIGEIKFLPRDIVASPQRPGIFGRVIEGPSLASVTERLTAFNRDRLMNVPATTLVVAFGHRTTHRLLAMIHLAQSLYWMEALPRMDNCELWLMRNGAIEVLHPGYPAKRDGFDPRRDTLK